MTKPNQVELRSVKLYGTITSPDGDKAQGKVVFTSHSLAALHAAVLAALPANPYSKRSIERMDEDMPQKKYINLVKKGEGYNQAISDMEAKLNALFGVK